MSSAELRALLKKEKRYRNTMDSVFQFTEEHKVQADVNEVQVRLQLLEDAYTQYDSVREKIEVIYDAVDENIEVSDSEAGAETSSTREARLADARKKRDDENAAIATEVENYYCVIKSVLLRLQAKGQKPTVVTPPPAPAPAPIPSKVKLPEIKLPTFGGKLRDWIPYRDAFKSLIHQNQHLTDMDKFTYLRSSLSEDALLEISSIELASANYEVAWDALENRYHNKKLIVKDYLDAIFSIEAMRKEGFDSLNRVISSFDKNLLMLQKLGEDTDGWSTLLVHMVCARLDPVTLRLWETHHNSKEVPEYDNLIEFLKNHCSVLQSVGVNKTASVELKKPKFGVSHASTAGRCAFCQETFHPAFVCKKFQKLKIAERYEAVRKNGLCMNCLSAGHMARICNKGSCRSCGRKHHSLLHPSNESSSSSNQTSTVPQTTRRPPSNNQQTQQAQSRPQAQHTTPSTHSNGPPPPTSTTVPIVNPQSQCNPHPQLPTDQAPTFQNTVALPMHTRTLSRQVLLSTAVVRVKDRFGNTALARALLDSCSQYCFVTSEFCQRLQLEEFPDHLSVKGIGGCGSVSKRAVEATITPRVDRISTFEENIQFNVLTQLTVPLPSEGFETSSWNIPEDMVLADPEFYETGVIDMIIGAEYYIDLLRDGRIKLWEDGPTLQNTLFGWIVSGRLSNAPLSPTNTAVFLCSMSELNEQLTKFWELETCNVKSTNSLEDTRCEEIFESTTARDEQGRFVVELPKKEFVIQRLGDSRDNAEKRFRSLERRFALNPELKAQYSDFMSEYLSMNHMQEVQPAETDGDCYYLPHHSVLRPDSTTTKLRVVFDASCRTRSAEGSAGFSLNDGLMVGPVVQDDLMAIVLRFRLHRIAIVADIAKMYRMIRVRPEDQKLQRILWRESPDEPVRVFQLTTVTYGTASAPYMATRCLQQLASESESTHPTASKILHKDFYVDDMITGVDTPEEGKRFAEEMLDLMSTAGFVLRKWSSNSAEVLRDLPADLLDERSALELDTSCSSVKTLGLTWEPQTDCFRFTSPVWNTSSTITKRIVVSDSSKLFDPLGLVGPVVVQAKIFIQTLWQMDCKWDEPLPSDLQEYWHEYRRNLSTLESLSIPRWTGFSNNCVDVELHGFCDASLKAYGACIYLRCTLPDGTTSVQLLTSKSRVAPLDELKKKRRKQSIPRLELASALLLSHLYEKVSRSISVPARSYFWTDSMIVRCWLASVPSRWQVFVANRVSEIQHLTKDGVWSHVPGVENPADVLSRGITPMQLQYHTIWFHGPFWLRQDKSTWPKEAQCSSEQFTSEVLEERSAVSLPVQCAPPNEIFSIHSSFATLVRITAYIHRFRHNAQERHRNCRKDGNITSQEYEYALKNLVRLAQEECFQPERSDLARGKQLKDSSRILALNPKMVDGILRVGGRLGHAPVSETRKHPMILDHRHPLSTLILRDYHRRQYHAGQQLLVASVRERFWITSIRSLARMIIHSCIDCYRVKPRPVEQLMAELPADRVSPTPPFLKVGMDYCGPFRITYPLRKAIPVKSFVCIFVCLVTKAVHIELVADLTTAAFLAALKRFVGRRGHPIVIYCDNAKNFVGAKRELEELRRLFRSQQLQNSVTNMLVGQRVDFKFIPPQSPNFGGLWEAAVKSFKSCFKKAIGTNILQYDEMHTVLPQVEAVLNSRPLTPISNDPGDFQALTPGHFLVQRPLTAIAEPNLEAVPKNRLTMWQEAQDYVQLLWKKWSTLYLSDLHNRNKWTKRRDNIAVGTMVLLMDKDLPPLHWRLGRVIEVFRGSDNNIRVVNVRSPDGIFKRAISKVCVLPIEDNTVPADGEN